MKITLSSAGLKNIVPGSCEKDFCFIFGKHELKMKNVFADFMSPMVSHLHQSDPTIDSIKLYDCISDIQSKLKRHCVNSNLRSLLLLKPKSLFSKDIVSVFQQLSAGWEIEINERQIPKMKLLSILLGNEELYKIINESCQNDINESNFDEYLQCFPYLLSLSNEQPNSLSTFMQYTNIIEFISKNFYSIDHNKLLNLPKSIIYSIISNKNLQLENEDSLIDFIHDIFSNDDSSYNCVEGVEDFGILDFFEQVDLSALSEKKFQEFLEDINPYKMSSLLWQKICQCITKKHDHSRNQNTDSKLVLDYDGNINHCFNGIIHHFTDECGGNVDENRIIKITASSAIVGYYPKFAADLEDNNHYFSSLSRENSWLLYDFKEKKINPSYYAIRTRHDFGRGQGHPKCWAIEGSNSADDNDWTLLDTRNGITELDDANAIEVFEIQTKHKNDEFRYLRIRQITDNSQGSYNLAISALEFFGSVSLQQKN